MALPWDDFRLVKAISERGGLTNAATHLGINHSTAFRRLAGIEAALGTRLFERSRSGYVPTPAGSAMATVAARMEADVLRFDREVAGRVATPSGELRITAPVGLVTRLLMPLLAVFRARHPEITLSIVAAEESLNLSRRDADVAIRASNHPPPNLVGRRLASTGWAVYGRSDTAYGDLGSCDWVGPGPEVAGGLFARFLRVRAERGRIVLETNTVTGVAEAIRAGLGIGPLPCFAADAEPALRRLGGLEPDLEGTLWLLTHPDLRESGRVRAFMDFMAEAIVPLRPLIEGRAFAG